MKKTAILFLVMSLLLSLVVFSCASGGGGGRGAAEIGPGVPAVGASAVADEDAVLVDGWEVYSDFVEDPNRGTSVMELEVTTIDGITAYRFFGSTGPGVDWPYIQPEFHPDAATLEAFKSAAALSFMVKGDGREYMVRYHVDSVTDWAWHSFTFRATAEPTRIVIPIGHFMQPSWGTFRRLDQSRFSGLSWQNSSWAYSGARENFDFTIWDLQSHQ